MLGIDVVAAAVLLVVGVADMRAVDDASFRSFGGWALALAALQTLPVAVRRLTPIPALVVCVAAQAVALYVDYPPTNALLAVPLIIYWIAYVFSRRVSALLTVASVIAVVPYAFSDAPAAAQFVLLQTVVLAAAALAGDGSKARQLYADTIAERARQETERRETEMREAVVEVLASREGASDEEVSARGPCVRRVERLLEGEQEPATPVDFLEALTDIVQETYYGPRRYEEETWQVAREIALRLREELEGEDG